MLYVAALLFLSLAILIPFIGFGRVLMLVVILIGAHLLIGFGFIGGLAFAVLFEPESYWKAYRLPELWMSTYLRNLSLDEPLWKFLVAPVPLAIVDFWRVYFHFSITNFSLPLFVVEALSWGLLLNYLRLLFSRRYN